MVWTEGLEAEYGDDLTDQMINAILLALKGYYIVSGLEVTQATDQTYVAVASGAMSSGVEGAASSRSARIVSVPNTNSRYLAC